MSEIKAMREMSVQTDDLQPGDEYAYDGVKYRVVEVLPDLVDGRSIVLQSSTGAKTTFFLQGTRYHTVFRPLPEEVQYDGVLIERVAYVSHQNVRFTDLSDDHIVIMRTESLVSALKELGVV